MELNVCANRNYILSQFHLRKKLEQIPYEDICNLASKLTDKIYTLEGENNNMSSELHSLRRILLAEGSDSAKDLYKKFSNSTNVQQHSNEDELQENIKSVQKENIELSKAVSDLQMKLEDKANLCSKFSAENEKLNKLIEHLKDENASLSAMYNSLEKKNKTLAFDCDCLCEQIRNFNRENADRLKAEKERQEHERLLREMRSQLDIARYNQEPDFEDLEELQISKIPSKLITSFDAHEGETCAINWFTKYKSRNEDYLATGGGYDRKVNLWKIEDKTAKLVATYMGSNKSINSIDVDEDKILATSNDYASRIWSLSDNKLLVTLTGHSAKVLAAKFMGPTNVVASCSHDRTVKIWDSNHAKCTRTYFAGSTSHDLIYLDKIVVTGHFDGIVRCWDIRNSSHEPDKMVKLQNKITSIDLSRNGFLLICSLRGNTIQALDIRKMEVLKTYFDDNFKIYSDNCKARFSHDGRYVCCGSADGSIFVWDVNTTKLEKVLPGSSSSVIACSWSPDGKSLATIERGRRVSIWGQSIDHQDYH